MISEGCRDIFVSECFPNVNILLFADDLVLCSDAAWRFANIIGNESLFMFEFKQRVKDCYLEEWTVNKNSKLSLFRNLKIERVPELY